MPMVLVRVVHGKPHAILVTGQCRLFGLAAWFGQRCFLQTPSRRSAQVKLIEMHESSVSHRGHIGREVALASLCPAPAVADASTNAAPVRQLTVDAGRY